MITDLKWELNCLKHLGKAMCKSGLGALLAKAREHSSNLQFGYSHFIVSLTSLTSRVMEALIVSPVFVFHTLFLYFETVVLKYTLRNVGSAPTRPRRPSRCSDRTAPSSAPPLPLPFREGLDAAVGEGVQPLAEFQPSILDLTLRNWQEYFSGGSLKIQ